MAKEIELTESGYKKLQEELEYLKNVKRKEAAKNVGEARSFGDLSENSEYDEAKAEQGKIEARILELEDQLSHIIVKSDHEIRTDKVNIGVTVTVFDIDAKEKDTYSLVGSNEADPMQGKISDQSPIGKALIGSKVGDVVTIDVPDGTIRLKIEKITKT